MTQGSSSRVIAIGDIHGCFHALDTLVKVADLQPDDTLVCLGDLIDQGRESKEVLELLIELSTQCNLVAIRGNHEEMFLAALESDQAKESWMLFGGTSTVNSYHFGGDIDAVPPDHVEFIRSTVDFFETETHIFTHALYLPDEPPEVWPPHVLRWTLIEKPYPEPHMSGKTVVVGHTEQRSGEILDLGHLICLDTACYNYGWLTALDMTSGETWQASKWGQLKERPSEPMPVPVPKPPVAV
ncbi:metallophosphoesterase family protein [Thalassoglobus sp. JC818]|uniref:metallophosphoesterase family protein n=1 Tax=Thalassoglobus sp. JC818 TaxID=3232136 RepID=UPI00345A7FBB